MQHEAGRQERLRDAAREDRRDSEPMRPPVSEIRRNPSTDQLKARKQLKRKTAGGYYDHDAAEAVDLDALLPKARPEHHRCPSCDGNGCGHCNWTGGVYASLKTATEVPTYADKLNPGDYIRGVNNQTVQVKQVRLHKTDANQVYVDTEGGTFAVPRTQNFTRVVGPNMRQQELPSSIGNPGGNSDVMPMSPGAGGMSPGSSHGAHNCPLDGSPMQLRNSGGNSVWVCPRDGYVMQAATLPGSGGGVTSSPDLLNVISKQAHYDEDMGSGWSGLADHLHQRHPDVTTPEGGNVNMHRLIEHDREHHGADAYTPSGWPNNSPDFGTKEVHKCPECGYMTVGTTDCPVCNRKHGALDEPGAGSKCPLCEGDLKGVGTNTARCEDCGTEVNVQRKQEVASKTAASWDNLRRGEGGHHYITQDSPGVGHCIYCGRPESEPNPGACRGHNEDRWRTNGKFTWAHELEQKQSSKYAPPLESAIARRARQVLGTKEMQ